MGNSAARGVISSSLDSTSLNSDTGVHGLFSTTYEFICSRGIALETRLDDDLLPNRSCSGERGTDGE